MLDALSGFLTTQRNRPLSIVIAVLSLFAPGSLIIFLARPGIFSQVGLNGAILLSVCISVPIVLLCYGIWYAPMSTFLKAQRLLQGEPPQVDFMQALKMDDPLEWPCLLAGAWTANVILFAIAAIAYYRPLRIGATLLLTAAILFGIWLLVAIVAAILDNWLERKWKEAQAAAQAAQEQRSA